MSFKFQIGDLVVTKAGVAEAVMRTGISSVSWPRVFTVVGRVAEECPAATQNHYILSYCGDVTKCHEIELMPFADFDVSAHSKDVLDSINKFADAKRRAGIVEDHVDE